MDYELRITEDQARVLRDACELYARVAMGQLRFIAELPQAPSALLQSLRGALEIAERYMQPPADVQGEEHDRTRRAWDLYQVIRGRLAWDAAGNPPVRPTIQVMYDPPLNTAGEPLALIQETACSRGVWSRIEKRGDWIDRKEGTQ